MIVCKMCLCFSIFFFFRHIIFSIQMIENKKLFGLFAFLLDVNNSKFLHIFWLLSFAQKLK